MCRRVRNVLKWHRWCWQADRLDLVGEEVHEIVGCVAVVFRFGRLLPHKTRECPPKFLDVLFAVSNLVLQCWWFFSSYSAYIFLSCCTNASLSVSDLISQYRLSSILEYLRDWRHSASNQVVNGTNLRHTCKRWGASFGQPRALRRHNLRWSAGIAYCTSRRVLDAVIERPPSSSSILSSPRVRCANRYSRRSRM